MSDGEYELLVLKPEDFEEVISVVEKHFLAQEPLSLGLNIAPADCRFGEGRFGEQVRASLQSGVSIGARVKGNGQLVGVSLSKISKRDESNDFKYEEKLIQTQGYICTLFEMSLNGVDVFGSEHKVLDVFLLTVSEEHGRKGLGSYLGKECIRLGKAAGCNRAVALITNRYTKVTLKKHGFETVNVLDLTKLGPEYKGPPLEFSRMNGNETISVMIKQGLP